MLLYLQTSANLKLYYVTCSSLIIGIVLFGGLLAPTVIYLPPYCPLYTPLVPLDVSNAILPVLYKTRLMSHLVH